MHVRLPSNGLETRRGRLLGFYPVDKLQPAMIRLNTVHYREWICSTINTGINSECLTGLMKGQRYIMNTSSGSAFFVNKSS